MGTTIILHTENAAASNIYSGIFFLYQQEMLPNKLKREEKVFKNLSAYMPIFCPPKSSPWDKDLGQTVYFGGDPGKHSVRMMV